jgi:hypothetical protein
MLSNHNNEKKRCSCEWFNDRQDSFGLHVKTNLEWKYDMKTTPNDLSFDNVELPKLCDEVI